MPVSQLPCRVISDFLCGSGQNGKGIFLSNWRETAHSRKALLPSPTVLCPAPAQIWSSQLHNFHLTGFPLPFHTPHPICSAVLPTPVFSSSCSCSQQRSITWTGFSFPLCIFPSTISCFLPLSSPPAHLLVSGSLPGIYSSYIFILCTASSE